MDHNAIQPFRCIYDPTLSRSQSKGPKPLIAKARVHEKSEDPRRKSKSHEKSNISSKRTVPRGHLPLPEFAKKLVTTTRCFITGLNVSTTRSKLYDTLCTFGPIKDCQVTVSDFTGVSLGIAWAEFDADALEMFSSFLHACESGKVLVDSCKLSAKPDRTGSHSEQAKKEAEDRLQVKEKIREAAELSKRKQELAPLELRDLSPTRSAEWFEKYLGKDPTYILIRRVTITPTKKAYDTISDVFKNTNYLHVAGNYTGIFIVYKSEDDAINALIKHQDKRIFGTPMTMSLTLSGDRIKQGELKRMAKTGRLVELKNRSLASSDAHAFVVNRKLEESNGKSESNQSNKKTSLSHSRRDVITGELDIPNKISDLVATQTLKETAASMKKRLFTERIEPSIKRVVERESKRRWDEQEQTSSNGSDAALNESNEEFTSVSRKTSEPMLLSEAEGKLNVRGGFKVPHWQAERAVNPFKPSKRISSMIFGTRIKKIKTAESKASASRSYVRAPINNADDLSGFDKKSARSETPDTPITEPEKSEEIHEGADGVHEDSMELKDVVVSRSKTKGSKTAKTQAASIVENIIPDDMMNVEGENIPEEEVAGMSIPPYPTSEDLDSVGSDINSFRGLVRNQSDFEALCSALEESDVTVDDDKVMKGELLQKLNSNLEIESDAWMPALGIERFRIAPVREYLEDERRQYLPDLGRGVPMEIVQSYSENPLYKVREKNSVNDEDRDTTKTLNVSRSSFNADSELFSGNNLSKNTKDTRLARSAIHQWGLYADQQIPANEFVIEYVGDMLRDEYAEIRERNYGLEGIDSTYLFRLDNGTVVDATKRGNGARFINHSCDPNCVPQIFDFDGLKRVVLFSLRDIEPDEESTFDYNFVRSHDEHFQVKCACGAANCRGWLM